MTAKRPQNAQNLERFVNPIVKDRKLAGGKTLFQSIAAGVDGEAAAMSLLSMLDNEAQHRKELFERFKGRPRRNIDSDDDAPSVENG